MPADILIPLSGGAFVSEEKRLLSRQLPATLIKSGLITTEFIKVEISADNGVSWFQAEDDDGVIQFSVTGKNILTIDSPMLFRLSRTAFTPIAITSVVTGTVISGDDYARFTYSSGPVAVVGNKILVAGFTTTNTPYNTTGIVTVTAATYFEIDDAVTGEPVRIIGTGTGTGTPLSTATLSRVTTV